MTIALMCLLALALLTLLGACVRIERLQDEIRSTAPSEHAKCMAMVAAFVSDEFAARILESAAEEYSTVEGQSSLRRLAQKAWTQDGPSMPALWLRERAAKIRGGDDA